MSEAISAEKAGFERASVVLSGAGRVIFSLGITALSIETLVCARDAAQVLGPQYPVIPVIPWLPAIPWLAYMFGVIGVACGVGLLLQRTERTASLLLGSLLFVATLILEVPKNAANIGSMELRTGVLEPLALGCLAWLLPAPGAIPNLLVRVSRYLLALSLIIFGVDHFLALVGIGSLLPNWIPWHVFWVGFFGAVFIAAGLAIALNFLQRWAAAGVGLMFGIWVFTLHLPRVMGFYGVVGGPHDPDEWSSLFIAVALWGGLWALAHDPEA
ncbi:MAG: hypothetical protein WAL74_17615 [Candidatus Acidiferrales bacterium]